MRLLYSSTFKINKQPYLITYACILSCTVDQVYLIRVFKYYITIAKTHVNKGVLHIFRLKTVFFSQLWINFHQSFVLMEWLPFILCQEKTNPL